MSVYTTLSPQTLSAFCCRRQMQTDISPSLFVILVPENHLPYCPSRQLTREVGSCLSEPCHSLEAWEIPVHLFSYLLLNLLSEGKGREAEGGQGLDGDCSPGAGWGHSAHGQKWLRHGKARRLHCSQAPLGPSFLQQLLLASF